MAAAVTQDTLATDRAVELARSGLPFREAYRRVAAEVGSADLPAGDAGHASVRARTSHGASGNLELDRIGHSLDRLLEDISRSPSSS